MIISNPAGWITLKKKVTVSQPTYYMKFREFDPVYIIEKESVSGGATTYSFASFTTKAAADAAWDDLSLVSFSELWPFGT